MANKFTFVGIDRYNDPNIRDLSGAGNDARALWALFADTFPNSRPELLVDRDATLANVRSSLERTLLSADAEDVVWIFFAGHGTKDHRLVMHDTRKSALAGLGDSHGGGGTTLQTNKGSDRIPCSGLLLQRRHHGARHRRQSANA